MGNPVFEVLYFTTPACNVCKVLLPELKIRLAQSFDHIDMRVINVEQEPLIAGEHGVFSAPVILLLIDGKEYIREGRNISIDDFIGKIDRLSELAK